MIRSSIGYYKDIYSKLSEIFPEKSYDAAAGEIEACSLAHEWTLSLPGMSHLGCWKWRGRKPIVDADGTAINWGEQMYLLIRVILGNTQPGREVSSRQLALNPCGSCTRPRTDPHLSSLEPYLSIYSQEKTNSLGRFLHSRQKIIK